MLKIGLILCTVFILSDATEWNISRFSDLIRLKRQDRWSWGNNANYNRPSRITVNSNGPPATQEDPSVCDPLDATVPNFHRPDRRLSETKCYEYIWQMKYRDDKAKRDKACMEYNRRKNGIKIHILVIGGREAATGEFPHMAAIGWQAVEGTWLFKCAGALISPYFVLTAAHCSRTARVTDVADVVPKIVRLGDKNILDTKAPHDVNIARIIVHPNYVPPRKYNDIALLRLEKDVEFSKLIQPACLWQFDTQGLAKATITGWGVVQAGARVTSPTLQTAEVDLIDSSTCDCLLRRHCNRLWCGVRAGQLCAGRLAGGVDSCQGDSGSPIQVRILTPPELGSMHSVIGVTSFGFGCARAATPGVYSRVSAYLDWIESVVWS